MNPWKHAAMLVTATTMLIATVACGTDLSGTPSANEAAASDPTIPPVTLQNLTAEQVLERAMTALENAQSLIATHTRTYATEDETQVQISRVQMSSPDRVYSYYESATRVSEAILFDGTVYQRWAETSDQLQSARWEGEASRQRSNEYFNVMGILRKLDAKEPVSISQSQGRYELTGTTDKPVIYGGFGSTKSTKYVPGEFTAIIDPSTFMVISASHEMTEVTTDSEDPEWRREAIVTVIVEFNSIDSEVTVTPPDGSAVDEPVYPTPTAAATPTPPTGGPQIAPTVFPTATAAPMPLTVTPTPHPPAPPNLPSPVPPSRHSEFQEQIDAAPSTDVFEVLPGIIVVYEPCGSEADGIVTAKLLDMSNEESSRGYMSLIHIQLSDGTWTVEHPGNTTSGALSAVENDASLMAEVVDRADPGKRCA